MPRNRRFKRRFKTETMTAQDSKTEELTRYCLMCTRSYNAGRIPKLLPCFHTFCMPCLETLPVKVDESDAEIKNKDYEDQEELLPLELLTLRVEASDEDNQVSSEDGYSKEDAETKEEAETPVGDKGKKTSSGKAKKKWFQCPACRSPVIIPFNGISGLQTNIYLTLGLDVVFDQWLCNMCEDGHQEKARSFCQQCQQRMCQSCRRLHDRVSGVQDHHVEPLAPAVTQRMKSSGTKKTCQIHPDQALCFHCIECDAKICCQCQLTLHEGHKTQDLASANALAKEELTSLCNLADEQVQMLDEYIRLMVRDEQALARQKKKTVQQARGRFDLLVSWVTRALNEFLEDVAAQEQACLTHIRVKRTAAICLRSEISVRKKNAFRTMNLGRDLWLVKNELKRELLEDKALFEYQELVERRKHPIFFRCTTGSSILELATVQAYIGVLAKSTEDDPEDPATTFP